MKKLLSSLFLLMMFVTVFSQDSQPVKNSVLGISFFFNDFKTAQYIRTNSLSSTLLNKKFGKVKDMVPGLALSYWQGINSYLDFSGTLAGSFLDYPMESGKSLGSESFLLEADASVHLKMLTDQNWVVPYLTAGVGVSKYKGYYGAIMPLGAGLQINIFDETFIMIDSQYRIKVSENTNYHFFHSIGIAGNIGRKKN
ncbi:MAG: hypothetical protein ABIN89_05585 [Chitinophagaceae bacterium]